MSLTIHETSKDIAMSPHFRFLHLHPRESILGLSGKVLVKTLLTSAVLGRVGSSSVVHCKLLGREIQAVFRHLVSMRRLASSGV